MVVDAAADKEAVVEPWEEDRARGEVWVAVEVVWEEVVVAAVAVKAREEARAVEVAVVWEEVAAAVAGEWVECALPALEVSVDALPAVPLFPIRGAHPVSRRHAPNAEPRW